MDSFSIYKGYGKIDSLESQHQPSSYFHLRRRSISSLLLLTLILVSLIGALVHESTSEGAPLDPIRYICNVTQHKETCFAAISGVDRHPKPNPVFILSILLRSTINELGNHLGLPKRLISGAGDDRRTVIALEDCGRLLNDAFGSLNQSEAKVLVAQEGLTEAELGDVRTWISAAMTDQETCLDGLEEVGASVAVVGEVRKAVQGATVGMSNTLAILANLDALKTDMVKMCHQPKH